VHIFPRSSIYLCDKINFSYLMWSDATFGSQEQVSHHSVPVSKLSSADPPFALPNGGCHYARLLDLTGRHRPLATEKSRFEWWCIAHRFLLLSTALQLLPLSDWFDACHAGDFVHPFLRQRLWRITWCQSFSAAVPRHTWQNDYLSITQFKWYRSIDYGSVQNWKIEAV